MATTDRPSDPDAAADEAAAQLRAAPFVRLVGDASGAGLAATGQLARALAVADVPFQASVAPLGTATRSTGADGLTVAVDRPDHTGDVALGDAAAAAVAAYHVAESLAGETDPDGVETAAGGGDPVLALAGLLAGGDSPASHPSLVEAAGLDRRPGVGVPSADLVDGLAHSTLFHAPDLSGDPEAVRERLDATGLEGPPVPADEDRGRRAASLAALAVSVGDAPPVAGRAIEAALRPHVGGPFETVPGYADFLNALAARAPGLGLQVAMRADRSDGGDRIAGRSLETVRSHWREHGTRAHAAVGNAETSRHDGVVAVEVASDAPVWTVARLVRDYVSPEPVVVVTAETAAVATTRGDREEFARAVEDATATVDGTVAVHGRRARAAVETPSAFATALREAI